MRKSMRGLCLSVACIFMAAVMAVMLGGCTDGAGAGSGDTAGTTSATETTTAVTEPKYTESPETLPEIKDDIKDFDNDLLMSIAKNYVIIFGFNKPFVEGDVIAYEQAYRFIKCGGVYSRIYDETYVGNDMGASIRPELRKYFDGEKETFTIPAKIVDDYILRMFNTVLDRSQITEYSESDDTYTFTPFLGEFYYEQAIEGQPVIDETTIRFTYVATPDEVAGAEHAPYHCTFTLAYNNGEYRYLSIAID